MNHSKKAKVKALNYWEKHKEKLIKAAVKQNPGFLINSNTGVKISAEEVADKVQRFFTDTIYARTTQGQTYAQAKKSTLNSTLFITNAEREAAYVKESIKKHDKAQKELGKQESNFSNVIKEHYRYRETTEDHRKGSFGKQQDAQYEGTININGNSYKKYAFINQYGEKIYIYEKDSPDGDEYDIFLSKEDMA